MFGRTLEAARAGLNQNSFNSFESTFGLQGSFGDTFAEPLQIRSECLQNGFRSCRITAEQLQIAAERLKIAADHEQHHCRSVQIRVFPHKSFYL
jgi:hypothetical protein